MTTRSLAKRAASRKRTPHLSFREGLRRVYAHIVSFALAIGTFAIIAVMFVMATGIHVPLPWSHDKGTASAAADQVDPQPKPKVVGKRSIPSTACPHRQTDDTTLFAGCPSFLLDYSARTKGAASTNVFNIYAGKPVANHEAQLYTNNSQNLRVENGSLVLEALNDPHQGFKYTSARVDTQGKEDFLYGKIVVRAKLPTGIGTWPAIWMLPSQPKYASMSPASDTTRYLNDGEVDIVESVGTQPHVVYGIAHSLAYPEDGPDRSYYNTITIPDNDAVFHDYEMDWTPTSITFKIDGKAYFTYSKQPGADYRSWPYDQPFYLVMNLALGGSWGGSDHADFPIDGVDSSALPASLKIQNVRYYSYIGPR